MRSKYSKISDPNSFISNPGSDEHILYAAKILSDGTISLTPCGKESISERINAEAEFTDISFIVRRIQSGDTSMIRDGAFYADLYSAPKSLAEAMQIQLDMERAFYELPVDQREKFNNNYRLWIKEAGEDIKSWSDKMNFKTVVEEEVIVDDKEQ